MKSVIYQMLPRLWGNGKFSSIDAGSLEYVKGLGAHYIWYTGIIRHATSATEKVVKGDAGSPYAIVDYYDVNPYLATLTLEKRTIPAFTGLLKMTSIIIPDSSLNCP